MRTVYLDTSVPVAALADEPLGSSARRAIASDRGGRPLISDWVVTEFSSAIALKVRSGKLAEADAHRIIAFFHEVAAEFEHLPVERSHFYRAAEFCRAFSTGLRGPDALHLAIGEAAGALILTLDTGMDTAGAALGVEGSRIA